MSITKKNCFWIKLFCDSTILNKILKTSQNHQTTYLQNIVYDNHNIPCTIRFMLVSSLPNELVATQVNEAESSLPVVLMLRSERTP